MSGGSAHVSQAAIAELVKRSTRAMAASVLPCVVYKPDGSASLFADADTGELCLHVKTVPEGQELEARLCGVVWCAPEEGVEVAVLVPFGDLSGMRPIVLPSAWGATQPGANDLAVGDAVVIAPKAAGAVRLGAAAGTVAIALAPPVEARLQALENHRHAGVTTGTGITGGALLASATLAQVEPATSIVNPASPDPGHLHDPDNEPGSHALCPAFKATAPGAVTAVAATKVYGL